MKLRDESKYEDRIFEAEEKIMDKQKFDSQSDYIHKIEEEIYLKEEYSSCCSLEDKKRLDLLEKGKFDLIKYNKITKQWGVLDSEDGFLYASDSSLRKCIDKLFGIYNK